MRWALTMIRLAAACRNTSVKRTTGAAPEPMMSARTCPGPTEGNWSMRLLLLRDFFDGADRESLVIVPLQQAANCFLAPAALFSAPTRLVVFGNVIFAAHRRPPNLRKGWSIKFSILMASASHIVKLNGYSQSSRLRLND